MKLINNELRARFRKVGRQEEGERSKVIAKFFAPVGAGTWLATEYDPKTHIFYGCVLLFPDIGWEWGSFSLEELESVTLPLGLKIERDIYCPELTVKEHKNLLGYN